MSKIFAGSTNLLLQSDLCNIKLKPLKNIFMIKIFDTMYNKNQIL